MERRIWHRFYDEGVPYEIPLPQETLVARMERTVRDFPDLVATDFFGAKLTYRQFADEVDRFAASLSGLGVKAGDRVAIMPPNCPQAVIAHYAALTIGAVAVMTNPMYVEREMEHQFKDAGVKVLVGLDHLYPRIAKVWNKTPVQQLVIIGIRDYLPFPLNLLYPLKARRQKLNLSVPYGASVYPFKQLIRQSPGNPPRPNLMVDDLAVLQYTGGTTGVAKGVMLSHRNLVTNIDQITAWVPAFQRGKERFLCVVPFFHVLGLTGNMNQSVCCGFTMIVLPRFELKMFLKTIAKTRPTVAVLVPTISTAMVNAPDITKYDLTSINYVVSGSAPLPVEIMRRFEELTGSVIIEG